MCRIPLRIYFNFCLFLILFCERSESVEFCTNEWSPLFYRMIGQDTTPSNSTVDSILDFLDDHIDELQFPKHQDIVFVYGTADSNKTLLISFITDAEIEAIETEPCSGNFTFVDKDGPINHYAPNIVPDLITHLLTDKKRGVNYYILPDFNVSTDVRTDLTVSHLMQRSLHFATGVKFMLTLSYATTTKSKPVANREVAYLIRKATTLITDIDKYSEAISLVVTNVDPLTEQSNQSLCRNQSDFDCMDREKIRAVISLLRATRDELEWNLHTFSPKESIAVRDDIKLIDILTRENESDNEEIKKIKIFRLASETGSVQNMPILQYEMVEIKSMIQRDTNYISSEKQDFVFDISNDTRHRIPQLIEETKRRLLLDVLTMKNIIKNSFEQIEKENFDLNILRDKMIEGYKIISQIKTDDLRSFLLDIIEAASHLTIEIPVTALNNFQKHIETYDFLNTFEEQYHKTIAFNVSGGLLEVTKYLDESNIWTDFLIRLHDSLSEYNIQKMVNDYEEETAEIMELCTIDADKEKNVTDIGLKDFVEIVNSDLYPLDPIIEGMKVNAIKLTYLRTILYQTMAQQAEKNCSPKKITVQGHIVRIVDLIEMKCPGDIQFFEIFAMHKIYIDADIEIIGKDVQFTIIAPTWYIVGNKRKITLNGENGKQHKGQAPKEMVGEPGNAGYSAGSFMGIGNKFINENKLEIHLTGGRGNFMCTLQNVSNLKAKTFRW